MDHRLAAIVLAAGSSRRMGQFKPLLLLGNRPLIWQVVHDVRIALPEAEVLLITGYQADHVRQALLDQDVRFVHNPHHEPGEMFSSVKAGIETLSATCDAFLIVLGDQPMVRQQTVRELCNRWNETRAPAVIPTHHGKRGHPIVIDASRAGEILSLPKDATLKTFISQVADRVVELPTDDPAVVADVDTPEDYQDALRRWEEIKGRGYEET